MKNLIGILTFLILCGFNISTTKAAEPVLINQSNILSEDYIPELIEFDNYQVHPDLIAPYNQMIAAMEENNLQIYIQSAYRSYNYQLTLFNNRVNRYINQGFSKDEAINKTKCIIAFPGTSEHQTGLAIDITIDGSLEQSFAQTKEGQWVQENCWNYGFIIRYPEDKTETTGIIFEPWHLRFIGKEHSLKMKELNLCLEEYVEYLKGQRMEKTYMVSREWDTINFTNGEYNRLKRWYDRNFKGQGFGAIGGGLSFHITPTSIGEIITAECGDKKFTIRDELNGTEDENINVTFGFDAQFVGSVEKELKLPSDTSDEQLVRIFVILMEMNYDDNCYIKVDGEIIEAIKKG